MQNGADITGRLLACALRRRAPLWLAALLPWALLLFIPGIVLALAWSVWDYRRLKASIKRDWTRWLDGSVPALEDSSGLLVHAASPIAQLQGRRLAERINTALTPEIIVGITQERVRLAWRWPVASVAAALALFAFQHRPLEQRAAAKATAQLAVPLSDLVVKVAPPKYTGVARFDLAPRDLQVPQQSIVEWCLKEPRSADAAVELSDGQVLKIGAACAHWRANESMFWRWRGKRYNLRVTPDLAPTVTITAPRDMLQVLLPIAASATIAVSVRDDYAVRRTALHMTLARGSGENIRFSDREVPLPEGPDPRTRNWSKQFSLAELGMEPGDELYFFVRTTDNAEPAHTTVSPTFTLRLPGPVEEEDETTALPSLVKPENLRSQRQVIIDTEQLIADLKANPKLPAPTVRARSEAIAGDQAMLRRRYGQFMGEESSLFGAAEEHDEHGAKDDVVAQYGHAHDQAENATLFDEATKKVLRRALTAMWAAEKALRAITPAGALPPEYKALAAIKELQQADRIYLHKTAFAPPPLKEEIRMTGDVVGTTSYRRPQGAAGEAVPADLRLLLRALGGEGALPALWSRTAQDWIRERITADEQRLEAQRAVQDVADGCAACRPVLRAWLRGAIGATSVQLQAQTVAESPFTRAWRKDSAK